MASSLRSAIDAAFPGLPPDIDRDALERAFIAMPTSGPPPLNKTTMTAEMLAGLLAVIAEHAVLTATETVTGYTATVLPSGEVAIVSSLGVQVGIVYPVAGVDHHAAAGAVAVTLTAGLGPPVAVEPVPG